MPADGLRLTTSVFLLFNWTSSAGGLKLTSLIFNYSLGHHYISLLTGQTHIKLCNDYINTCKT